MVTGIYHCDIVIPFSPLCLLLSLFLRFLHLVNVFSLCLLLYRTVSSLSRPLLSLSLSLSFTPRLMLRETHTRTRRRQLQKHSLVSLESLVSLNPLVIAPAARRGFELLVQSILFALSPSLFYTSLHLINELLFHAMATLSLKDWAEPALHCPPMIL